MTCDDIIRMAREAKLPSCHTTHPKALERFAVLIAAHQREKMAKWMIERGYATGHGDTIEDLLTEIDWQAAEREQEMTSNINTLYSDPNPIEILRITKEGVWANPDIPVDEAAKKILDAIDHNIKVLVQKAVEMEREECAKLCDDARDNSSNPAYTVCSNLAHRIRARGKK